MAISLLEEPPGPAVELTLADCLNRGAVESGRIAVVAGEGSLGYGELRDRSTQFALWLRELGIGAGDVVALQVPNRIEFLISYLGAAALGAVTQTVHLPYRAADIEPLLRHSRARAVVALSALRDYPTAEVLLELHRTIATLEHVIVIGDGPPGTLAWFSAGARQNRPHPDPPRPADPFLLLYTSGTTASPKGVLATYRQFLPNAVWAAAELGLGSEDTLLCAAPFTHLYGLFTVHLTLAIGARLALLPAFQPDDFLETIERERVTAAFTAPAHLAACLQSGALARRDLSSLRFVMVSGSPCPPDLARAFEEKLPTGRVVQLWGMTELQVGAFTRPAEPLEVRITTIGRPSPGTSIRIIGEDDGITDLGVEGEIQVKGASVFAGYFENETANQAAFTDDGWFRTGDLGYLGPGGHLRITGRMKDVINRGGVKFNPTDIEALLTGHPAIRQVAIVPMPDRVLGERACCFAVLEPATSLTLEAVCEFLEQCHVAKNKWPERLEVIDSMPLTPTGKVIKSRLRTLLE